MPDEITITAIAAKKITTSLITNMMDSNQILGMFDQAVDYAQDRHLNDLIVEIYEPITEFMVTDALSGSLSEEEEEAELARLYAEGFFELSKEILAYDAL